MITRLRLIAFTVGMSTLGSEIAAARLLAPYFGESTIVWANTIGIVLVSLAIGYWLGGILADRSNDAANQLYRVVAAAGVLIALIPFAAGPFLHIASKSIDQVSAGGFLGSLVGTLVLIAPPLVLAGTVSPWSVKLAAGNGDNLGKTSGSLFAISTLGSLVGTFLTSLVLIQVVGTQRTFILLGLLLAIVAASQLRGWSLLLPVAVLLLMLLPPGITKPAAAGTRLLEEAESRYQYARVLQRIDAQGKSNNYLELNEGQAVHSLLKQDQVATGNYWDAISVLPAVTGSTGGHEIAVLGNAGGTSARAMLKLFPDAKVTGVELDPKVSALGQRWLGLPNSHRLQLVHTDARRFLASNENKFQTLVVDAYRQPYIPFQLTTKEFFQLALSRMQPNGMLLLNVGHPEGSSKLSQRLTATLRTVFGSVSAYQAAATNTILIASQSQPDFNRLNVWASSARRVDNEFTRRAKDIAAVTAQAEADGKPFTDDKAPVELLIDGSLLSYIKGS